MVVPGAVNSKVLLALVYYLVLVPVAVIYGWKAGDSLKLKRAHDNRQSYWTVRDHSFEPRDFERP